MEEIFRCDTESVNVPLHRSPSSSSTTSERVDLLKSRLKRHHRDNPEKFFKLHYPFIKNAAIDNFYNELQRADPKKDFKEARTKRFQIFNSLLNCPELCSKIVFRYTANIKVSDFPVEPTTNWINHSPLDEYFKNPENHVDDKYDGTSLISFLRFIRNTMAHFLQSGESFRIQILGTKEMSRAAFCEFFDKRYPELFAFLVWLYACACDSDNEIVKLLGAGTNSDENSNLPDEDKLELLVKEDLVEFLIEMINFFFGDNSITKEEIEVIIDDNLEFNENVGFLRVKPKIEALKKNEDQTKKPKIKNEKNNKQQKKKKGKYVPFCEECKNLCTCDKENSDNPKSQ